MICECGKEYKLEHEYVGGKCNECLKKDKGIPQSYDWNDANVPVQGWVIAYKDNNKWDTIRLPGFFEEEVVDAVIIELNKESDIVWSRKKQGCLERDNHYTRKDEFIGVSL